MASNSFFICVVLYASFVVPFILSLGHATAAADAGGPVPVSEGPTVKKDERWQLVSSEFGEISAVKIKDGGDGSYYLQFITMEPHSLFLPVHLHSEMLLFVNSGGGTLTWTNIERDEKLQQVKLQMGDIYRLQPGTLFYLQNNLKSVEPQKLQFHAIFSNSKDDLKHRQSDRAYVAIHELVLGFDDKVLQSSLGVPEEVIKELRGGETQPLIIQDYQGLPEAKSLMPDVGSWVIRAFLGTNNIGFFDVENNKKPYNIYNADHDVENCYGWSVTVTRKQLEVLKHSKFGVFMVNLTTGAMMGPHWNLMSVEIAVVLHGQGMVSVVCPSISNEIECKNSRFKVEEGDVFVVPRYYPMAHISFNNDSLVFVGFTITPKHIPVQFIVGEGSMFKMLDKHVLAMSFNVSNTTMDRLLMAQRKSVILECTSCAEEEEWLMEEESEGGGQKEPE